MINTGRGAMRPTTDSFEGNGKLVTNAKSALNAPGLANQLMQIKSQYSCLIELIEQSESREFSIRTAQTKLAELNFGEDSCSIREYIDKRMMKTPAFKNNKRSYLNELEQISKFLEVLGTRIEP